MYSNDRRQMRQPFLDAWRKQREGLPMTALELKISEVIGQHPEYHELMSDPERALEKDWLPENGETNPFLHLGFHLSIREMVEIDQPPGFRQQYQALCRKSGDMLSAEHLIMECLSEALWRAQRDGTEPDGTALLRCMADIVG
ncbi:MAG: DUF1841 family protein [Halothiobacillus sp.]|nr:DUF1841 family protein [Halothiobacillus sp.]